MLWEYAWHGVSGRVFSLLLVCDVCMWLAPWIGVRIDPPAMPVGEFGVK